MRIYLAALMMCVAGGGCLAMGEGEGEREGEPLDEDIVAEAEEALSNGFAASPTAFRAAWIDGCSATVIDPLWVLTARHCLRGDPQFPGHTDKAPGWLVHLGSQQRTVTHVYLHPKHLQKVDVMMLRLDAPFTNIPFDEYPIYTGNTDDLIGQTAICLGYGGTSPQLKGGIFEVVEATAPYYQTPDPDWFYQLESVDGAQLIDGDSGSSCRTVDGIIGVHKGGGQVSAEAWADWALKRRECAVFDPNHPSTSFCSADCPCDVGEGDCDGNDQCLPGLKCVNVGTDEGLPSTYAVCERINPASCGTFPADAWANFCRFDANEICACAHGQGDCDEDHDCGGSLECQEHSGAAVGLAPNWAVCVYPTPPGCNKYVPTTGTGNDGFCTVDCPCDIGQGDCDNNDQCRQDLVCASNVGAQFELDPGVDVCVRP